MKQNTDHTLDHWVDVARSGSFKNSMNYFAGDDVTTEYDINFAGGYIKKEDVKCYQVNPVTGARFEVLIVAVNGMHVTVDRPTPVGRNLVIYRDTDKRAPLVDFADNSIINERNLDLNAKQSIFSVAEMLDRFDDSVRFAADAAGAVEESRKARDEAIVAQKAAEAAQTGAAADAKFAEATATKAEASSVAAQVAEVSAVASSNTSVAASLSAADSKTKAALSETNAQTYQGAASASATLAKNWATQTSGEVTPGQGYSAKKYAADAKVEADRSKANADSIDPTAINSRIDANTAAIGTVSSKVTALETNAQSKVYGLNQTSIPLTTFSTAADWNAVKTGEHHFARIPAIAQGSYFFVTRVAARDQNGGATYIAIDSTGTMYVGAAWDGGAPTFHRVFTSANMTFEY